LRHPALISTMGRKAREKVVKECSYTNTAKTFLNIYYSIKLEIPFQRLDISKMQRELGWKAKKASKKVLRER